MLKELQNEIPFQLMFVSTYLVVVAVYLLKLDRLNKLLISYYNQNDFLAIVSHNNNQPLRYVLGAIILYLVGAMLIFHCFRKISQVHGVSSLVLVILVLLIVFCLVLVWSYINNPILRAVLSVVGILGLFVAASIKS